MYTSPERLYLDKDGNVVTEDSPAKATLLVRVGGTLTDDEARRYGLIGGEKAVTEPKANKMLSKPPANKAKE